MAVRIGLFSTTAWSTRTATRSGSAPTGVETLRLGGTSILIVVGVVVETMKQPEAQPLMRSDEGFIR